MFKVVTVDGTVEEERKFRDKPEALVYAIERLRASEGKANVEVRTQRHVVFDVHSIRRTLNLIRH